MREKGESGGRRRGVSRDKGRRHYGGGELWRRRGVIRDNWTQRRGYERKRRREGRYVGYHLHNYYFLQTSSKLEKEMCKEKREKVRREGERREGEKRVEQKIQTFPMSAADIFSYLVMQRS